MTTQTNGTARSALTPKQRMAIPRQSMPAQDALIRQMNFEEVNLGLDEESAVIEAERCLQCKKPLCIAGCPVHIDIPRFIQKVANKDFVGAAAVIKESSSLPAVCGRVCPQETQCEEVCVVAKKYVPIAIGNLERFTADQELLTGNIHLPTLAPSTGKRIAVVGSGPAGLACAADLVVAGHQVTIFEALHDFGGVLLYGIPEFRLPKKILEAEIANLERMGVNLVKNFVIGKTMTIDELVDLEGYDAIFIGTGAGLPWLLDIPGQNLGGVYSANEFLTRVNLMKGGEFPRSDTPVQIADTVVVIGGGNTAMDAVRTAKRLGARRAIILYRRSHDELPARVEEIHHAEEEGIEFMFLTNPLQYIDGGEGWMTGIECEKMELGEPDDSGRRRPVSIPGTKEILDAQMAVVAIGNGSNPLISQTTPDLEVNKHGHVLINEETGQTSRKEVFAGGDIVSGGATVILAMGEGRRAAKSINEFLSPVVAVAS